MFTKYLALVSESDSVPFGTVAKISSALQKQITRDFTPIWNIPATIDAFESLDDVPSDYLSILIKDDIGYNAAGIHLDRNGQPYALVAPSGETTGLTCSHECLEMLVDPFGNEFVASDSIKTGQGRVKYLVEVCDPSEDEQFGYAINGILVSDFYTPHFFDPVASNSVRYSYTDAIKKPRQVLKNGYLSWMIPETGVWWQAKYFGASMTFENIGVLSRNNGQSWRETIDSITTDPIKKILEESEAKSKKSKASLSSLLQSKTVVKAAEGSAKFLREDIKNLLSRINGQ